LVGFEVNKFINSNLSLEFGKLPKLSQKTLGKIKDVFITKLMRLGFRYRIRTIPRSEQLGKMEADFSFTKNFFE
jgi:hypothetical protein